MSAKSSVSQRRRAAGFTLIEVLIAFTLTAIIMSLLYSAMHLAGRAWDTTEEQAQRSNDLRAVHNFLRRKLRQTRLLTWHPEGRPGEDVTLVGGPDSLRFVAPAPAYLGPRGLHVLRLSLRRQPDYDGSELVLSWQPYAYELPPAEPLRAASAGDELPDRSAQEAPEAVVIRRVDALSFSYFGAVEGDDEPRWWDEWDAAEALPELIEVRIRGEALQWPDLIVDLHQ